MWAENDDHGMLLQGKRHKEQITLVIAVWEVGCHCLSKEMTLLWSTNVHVNKGQKWNK